MLPDGATTFTKPIRFKVIIKTAERPMKCGRCSQPIQAGEKYGHFYASLFYCCNCLDLPSHPRIEMQPLNLETGE